MRWSIGLGRVAGIDVKVHVTFLLLLGFVGFTGWSASRGISGALENILFYILLFACVLLHEFGHALAARRYGIRTRDITLLPIGGVARLESTGETPKQELVIALAGPAVNVLIAIVLAGILFLTPSTIPSMETVSLTGNPLLLLLIANLFLVAFNLLPAFPMDGGRVLRALLLYRMDRVRATQIAAYTGKAMAVLFAFGGLFYFNNPILLFIALFVWLGAGQEAAAVQTQSLLDRVQVRSAMLTDFQVISPFYSLAEIIKLILAGSQRDFPVVNQGELVGVLVHADFFKALNEVGPDQLAQDVMQRNFVTASPTDPLEDILKAIQEKGQTSLTVPVLWEGRLVGLVTPENINEFFMVRTAMANRKPPVLPTR
jgi:Zn-dependent protease/predicted transcriptional regulator